MTDLMIVERMGKDICVIRSALIKYMCNSEYQKLTRRNEKDELNRAQNVITDYRSLSESHFFRNGIIDSTKVFYRSDIKSPPFVEGDVCAMCERTVTEDGTSEKLPNYYIAEKMGMEMQLIIREVKRLMSNPEYVRLADKEVTDKLSRLVHYLDRYVTKTVERLIDKNVIVNGDVFYNLEDGSIADMCLYCHREMD